MVNDINNNEYNENEHTLDNQIIQEDAQMDFELRRVALEDVPIPDIDEAFEQFKSERIEMPVHTTLNIRLLLATVAAACLIIALFIPWNKWLSSAKEHPGVMTADVRGNIVYEASDALSDIVLTDGEEIINLHSKDAQKQGFTVGSDEMIKFLAPENVSAENRSTLMIPQGKTAKLLLPDGSKVWLSACSRLIFPHRFLGNAPREVRLIGEAFFEVTHDEKRPFIVHSGNISTTVLGTTFNVRCFEGEQPRVTLASGSVQVSNNGDRLVRLMPGQQAMLGDNNSFNIEEADVEGVTNWRNGGFYFENQTLREVLTEIGRWYNYNVIFTGNNHLRDKLHYNGERSWTVSQVISQLNRICETKIKIEGNNIIVDE
ncbi:MAG: FecR domain-containing protein [Prevotella sp.]|nr:FecR domain-containing protein [Prevotella sp.]